MKSYNPSLFHDANRILDLKGESPEVTDELVPIVVIQPRCDLIKHVNKSTTGSATLLTSATGKDTYLTGLTLAFSANAACDHATGEGVRISVVTDGVTANLLSIPVITLTAISQALSISFPVPVKIDRSSAVTVNCPSYTAGVRVITATLVGYTVETQKGN